MGMFDTVIVSCPNCGEETEFQSKSGDCMLRHYTLEDCPDDVLSNVNRHAPYDCHCGVSFEVDVYKKIAVLVWKGEGNGKYNA